MLPSLSKAFEKCLYDQISAYTDSILSTAQYGFIKGCSTQYSINGESIRIKAAYAEHYLRI